MSRSVTWRRTCSDAASWHQDEALSATMFILHEIGPTGFLLKDDSEEKKVRVFIGDPHRCSCSVFSKEHDLCKHICWVLLKKFRVPRHNPVTWQLGLVEREIQELLRGVTVKQDITRVSTNKATSEPLASAEQKVTVAQREITDSDICPVCQDELLAKHQPVTYCRNGCGNSVHIKCMTVWAEHQLRSTGKSNIECPFCRVDFGPLSSLQAELSGATGDIVRKAAAEHGGVVCQQCHSTPIVGKCYRCITCSDVYLCQTCFNSASHADHPFHYRQKPNQRWNKAPSRNSSLLPEAVISNLMAREISEEDYELLVQLDNNSTSQPSDLTEASIASFPLHRIPRNGLLLAPGHQCRVCLRGYQEGDQVRRLPCRHQFHKNCIDDWLIHRHPTCPVDGIVYSNESVRLMNHANQTRCKKQSTASIETRKNEEHCEQVKLELSGLKLSGASLKPAAQTKEQVLLVRVNEAYSADECSAHVLNISVLSHENGKEARQRRLDESGNNLYLVNNVAMIQARTKPSLRSNHSLLTIGLPSQVFSSNEDVLFDVSQDSNANRYQRFSAVTQDCNAKSSSSETCSRSSSSSILSDTLATSGVSRSRNVFSLNSDQSRLPCGGLPRDSSKVRGHGHQRLKPLVDAERLLSNKVRTSQPSEASLSELYVGLNPFNWSPQLVLDSPTHCVINKTNHLTSPAGGNTVCWRSKLVSSEILSADHRRKEHRYKEHRYNRKTSLDELRVTGNNL